MHTRRADQSVQICSDPFECLFAPTSDSLGFLSTPLGESLNIEQIRYESWIFFRTWKRLPVALRFRPLFLAHSLWSQLGKTGPRDHSDAKCSGRQIQQFRLSEVCIEKLKGQTSQKKVTVQRFPLTKKRCLILKGSLSSVRKCSAKLIEKWDGLKTSETGTLQKLARRCPVPKSQASVTLVRFKCVCASLQDKMVVAILDMSKRWLNSLTIAVQVETC